MNNEHFNPGPLICQLCDFLLLKILAHQGTLSMYSQHPPAIHCCNQNLSSLLRTRAVIPSPFSILDVTDQQHHPNRHFIFVGFFFFLEAFWMCIKSPFHCHPIRLVICEWHHYSSLINITMAAKEHPSEWSRAVTGSSPTVQLCACEAVHCEVQPWGCSNVLACQNGSRGGGSGCSLCCCSHVRHPNGFPEWDKGPSVGLSL